MNPRIVSYDSDRDNGNMVVIDSGRLTLYNKINNVRRETSCLARIDAGHARIGEWTTLNGHWASVPSVVLSAKELFTYFYDMKLRQQRFTLGCEVAASSPGVYAIRPTLNFIFDAVDYTSPPINYSYTGNPSDSDVITPYYVGTGTLNVNFSYYSHWVTQASEYMYNVYGVYSYVYLDYINGTIFNSILLAQDYRDRVGGVNVKNAVGINLGEKLCRWRLRLRTSSSFLYSYQSGALSVDASSFLKLETYSYSAPRSTISSSGEVFYLAMEK